MKKIILSLICVIAINGILLADDVKIHKGRVPDGYKVYISSYGVMRHGESTFTATAPIISISSDDYYEKNNTDYVIDNQGSIDFWIDGSTTVYTSGTNEAYKLQGGKSISPNGRVNANIYSRTLAGSTGYATCYIFLTAD